METDHPRLILGKRAAFVKTHLKRLPQEEETPSIHFTGGVAAGDFIESDSGE
jgi:hypothetical protein